MSANASHAALYLSWTWFRAAPLRAHRRWSVRGLWTGTRPSPLSGCYADGDGGRHYETVRGRDRALRDAHQREVDTTSRGRRGQQGRVRTAAPREGHVHSRGAARFRNRSRCASGVRSLRVVGARYANLQAVPSFCTDAGTTPSVYSLYLRAHPFRDRIEVGAGLPSATA